MINISKKVLQKILLYLLFVTNSCVIAMEKLDKEQEVSSEDSSEEIISENKTVNVHKNLINDVEKLDNSSLKCNKLI